ncbi:hypothetical protein A3740_25705 [Oleiphilus sp. HI0068]|nr:hypothetical protein A3741_01645 [Oleiphilus sp. HI0069]KZY78557.1 hypothetical protein A3740_07540 [Oleiphilus sp. HI0068]KZY80991.1 hypothetical protein A3740_25705 [Oleiphilus sp. HI0068]KZY85711.1 hypothetical protein A3741_27495 [Oleiphilus sp. HI0069]
MFLHQDKYEKYIKEQGVGSNDNVADSVKSYISYLNSVQKHLDIMINENTLSSDSDIRKITSKLSEANKVSNKTINNYRSAMRQYVAMVSTW